MKNGISAMNRECLGGRWEAKEKRGGDLNFFQGVRTSGKISWEEVRMRKS